MAKTQEQLNAAILANRQKRDEAHQASLKRLYGEDLDTTNPAAVNAARAAKQAAAAQARMDARQVRDNAFAAKQAIGEKQAEQQNAADRIVQLKEGADRVAVETAKEDKIRLAGLQQIANAKQQAMVNPAPPQPTSPNPQVGAPAPQPQVLPQQNNPMLGANPAGAVGATGFGAKTMRRGGAIKMASGGSVSKVSTASRRGDGIAQRGKTKGRYL